MKFIFLPILHESVSGKVEAVDPTIFLVTEHTENYRKVDFPVLSHPFHATEWGPKFEPR